MALITLAPRARNRRAGWLADHNSTDLERDVVERAFDDIGILEDPLGSNQGTRINEWTKRAGLPAGQWWCAIWVGAVLADCGLKIPNGYPACDNWLPYIDKVKVPPRAVCVVLYGLRKATNRLDAHHIGIVVRKDPLVLTIEGNRSFAGTASNNGLAVDIGPMTRRDILGYITLDKLGA